MTGEIVLDPSQRRAVDLITGNDRLSIVTGGPGTGKSSSLRFALDVFDDQGIDYALAAPTGKAAKRMSEATERSERPACTIHRLLGYQHGGGFARGIDSPLEHDVIVVDEASMIDLHLFDALSCAIDKRRTRLVLIGDVDQLPPVGPGQPFADLIEAEACPVARLRTLHRSAAESWICRNAPKILRGGPLELEPAHDFEFHDFEGETADTRDAAVRRCVELYDAARKNGEDVVVLAPQKPGPAGTRMLNALIKGQVNPTTSSDAHFHGSDGPIASGDVVIQTVNNYDLGVFNGEVGVVQGFIVDEIKGTKKIVYVTVDFGDRCIDYPIASVKALRLAYASTVHKYQGSEVATVIMFAHSTHTHSLSRRLLYTGLTRGKKRWVIVGNKAGIKAGLSALGEARNSGLPDRLREAG